VNAEQASKVFTWEPTHYYIGEGRRRWQTQAHALGSDMSQGFHRGHDDAADLELEQHAYRAEPNALDAVRQLHGLLSTGHTPVLDADLSGDFDSIPPHEPSKSVSRRVRDRQLLKRITRGLKAAVEEIDDRGRHHRTTRNRDEGRGSPPGSPLSPLLANVCCGRISRGGGSSWGGRYGGRAASGRPHRQRCYNFVICCRGIADEAMQVLHAMMSRRRLTVNATKTRLCRVPEESFHFLGYMIGRCHSPRTGRSYVGTKPSAQKIEALKAQIHELTSRRWRWTTVKDRVAKLNRMLLGWSNDFGLGPVSAAYQAIERHARHRLRQWLRGSPRCKVAGPHDSPTRGGMRNLASSA
jgi:RNA-directed DNA polymerase